MIYRFYIFVCLLLSSASLFASAGEYQHALQVQQMLEERVNALVRFYDAQAFSVVNVLARKNTVELPGAPFYFEDFRISEVDGRLFEKIDVSIVSRLKDFPSELPELVKKLLAPHAPLVLVELKRAPAATQSQFVRPQMEIGLPSSVGVWLGIGILLALLGALAFSLRGVSKGVETGAKNLATSLSQGVASLAEAGGLGSSSTVQASALTSATAAGASSDGWDQMSTATCLALLSDCYWCYQDAYASFIWERLSVSQRMAAVAAWPVLSQYVRHLAGVKAMDLSLHRDVAYLSPVDVHLWDNTVLTEQTKSHPALLERLSPLRSEALDLGIAERLQLQTAAKQQSSLPALAALPPSPLRSVRQYARVRVQTDARESEVLNLRDLPVEAKEQFVTLAWMVQLPKATVTTLLDRFSARDLATAWVGPSALLSFLSDCLPGKKRELLESYRQQVAPSRESECFLKLHALAMDALKIRSESPAIAAEASALAA